MSDDDLMLTAEERRLKQRKRRRLFVSVLLLVLLLVLGFFGGRPTLNAIKAWQARRHADKAFALIAQEKWGDARGEAVAAYQLRPTEPQAIRAVARFLSRTRQPDALEFWKQLQDLQPLTRDDLRDEAAIALAAGDMPRADDAVQKLIAADAGPADWLLAAQLSVQKGAPENARASLEKVLSDPKASEREQFQAILFGLASSQNQDQVNDAWSRLEKLSRGPSATALDALVLLARRALSDKTSSYQLSVNGYQDTDGGTGSVPSGELVGRHGGHPSTDNKEPITDNPDDSTALSQALSNHPLAKAPQKLLALDVRAANGGTGSVPSGNEGTKESTEEIMGRHGGRPSSASETRAQLVARAIAEFKDADADSLTALASWLNSKGEYQKTLDTVPLAKALQDRDLFLQHVDALGALGRWKEIKDLLDGERYPLDRVVQFMYMARCNAQLGEITASENNWKRALEAAGGDAGKLLTLADYAEKNGNLVVAQQAFETAAMESPKLRPAWQGRLRMAQASRDTKKIHDVLVDMLKLWPNDSAVQNDEAYLRLLLMAQSKVETNVEAAVPAAGSKSIAGDTPATTPGSRTSEDGSQTSDAKRDEGVASPTTLSTSQPLTSSTLNEIERLAADLVQKEPASMPHRTLLALARLKQNRAAEALEVYSNIQVTPNALTPSALAVHAAVLAANGKTDDAKREAQQIKIDNLVPEERQLIEDLL